MVTMDATGLAVVFTSFCQLYPKGEDSFGEAFTLNKRHENQRQAFAALAASPIR